MLEDIERHGIQLESVVSTGHELEKYTSADPSTLPDIGYSALEDRYDALKVSVHMKVHDCERYVLPFVWLTT